MKKATLEFFSRTYAKNQLLHRNNIDTSIPILDTKGLHIEQSFSINNKDCAYHYRSEWGFVNFIINELKINGQLGTNKAKNGVDLGKYIKDADDFYSINIDCNRINEYLEGLDQFSIKNIRKKILNSDGKKKPIFLKEKDKIIRFSDAFFTKLTYENYKGVVTKKVHSFKIYVPKLIFKPIIENKFTGDGFFQLPARFEPLTRMCHEDLKNNNINFAIQDINTYKLALYAMLKNTNKRNSIDVDRQDFLINTMPNLLKNNDRENPTLKHTYSRLAPEIKQVLSTIDELNNTTCKLPKSIYFGRDKGQMTIHFHKD